MSELTFRNGDTLDKRLRREIKRVEDLTNLEHGDAAALNDAKEALAKGSAGDCLMAYHSLKEIVGGYLNV